VGGIPSKEESNDIGLEVYGTRKKVCSETKKGEVFISRKKKS